MEGLPIASPSRCRKRSQLGGFVAFASSVPRRCGILLPQFWGSGKALAYSWTTYHSIGPSQTTSSSCRGRIEDDRDGLFRDHVNRTNDEKARNPREDARV